MIRPRGSKVLVAQALACVDVVLESFAIGLKQPLKAKRPDQIGAHFSTRTSVPHYKNLSREIFTFFENFLTPNVFKRIVVPSLEISSPKGDLPCRSFFIKSVTLPKL